MKRRAAGFLMAALCLAAAPPLRAETSAKWTREDWAAAAALHQNRCAECHRLYEPSDYSEEDWTSWIRKMKRKARLSLSETRLLSDYTQALRRNDKFEFKRPADPDEQKNRRPKRVLRPVGL
jgi:hypothetical protein